MFYYCGIIKLAYERQGGVSDKKIESQLYIIIIPYLI